MNMAVTCLVSLFSRMYFGLLECRRKVMDTVFVRY